LIKTKHPAKGEKGRTKREEDPRRPRSSQKHTNPKRGHKGAKEQIMF